MSCYSHSTLGWNALDDSVPSPSKVSIAKVNGFIDDDTVWLESPIDGWRDN